MNSSVTHNYGVSIELVKVRQSLAGINIGQFSYLLRIANMFFIDSIFKVSLILSHLIINPITEK